MKKALMIICAIWMIAMKGFATEIPLLGNILGRNGISLNGEWNYIVDVQELGNGLGFHTNKKAQGPEDLVEFDFDKSKSMHIPSDWNTQDDQLFFYEGTVWFKKSFMYHPMSNKRTILYFGAVNYEAFVYVNGQKVGSHIGGFTPFNFDVTDALKDGENVVVVKVDNKRHAESVPTLSFDWWNYGGITRDVWLVDVEPTYVEDYSLQLDKNNYRLIHFSVRLNKPETGQKVTVRIPELKIDTSVTTGEDGTADIQIKAKPQLWSPENPKLYKVEIARGSESLKDEIGFRTITTKGKQLLLNGQPIFLRGVCVHEEKPLGGGRANSTQDAHTLLSWAKEMECNFVRLAHYPHNEYAIREAERMGILVWSEIPNYWHISWSNTATYENAQRQLHDMIARDHNRAAVIIWSIANETPYGEARDNFLSRLSQYAKAQDPTRLISMAMQVTSAVNYHNKLQDNMNQYVDIISFNEYIGWYRDVNDAAKMTWEIPYDKPVIVSEFGGGALQGYHGEKNQRWTEEFQENVYIENTRMLDKIDGLVGTTPWILKDFRSPRRVLTGIQDYYNRKGLFSDQGEKKKAFWVLKAWYEGKK